MPLEEVLILNKRKGWGRRNPNVSGTVNQFKQQFNAAGGLKGMGSALAGFAVCAVWAPRRAGKYGTGWKGVGVAVGSALAGGLILNRFVKDKTVSVWFTAGGLIGAGGMAMKRLFPRLGQYMPGLSGIGSDEQFYNQDVFGLGDEELDMDLDEDLLSEAPFSPESALWPPEYAGDRTVSTAFNAADEGIESIDDDLIPTFTGVGQ
jgi:hypothetical protein